MVPTCRPEKAARFVFRQLVADAAAPMRASPARLTFSDRHDQERHVASASRIRQGRSRFRARRGRLADGERYLDFTSGVAVNALGHCHPHLVAALQEQATKLWHMSNLFKSPDGERLAARLCEQSFADFVFFANSGAEAVECAIKITRRHHAAKGHPERYRIVTFDSAFHGRTLATLAATGSAKYLEGFGPPMDGFDQVLLGDLEAVKKAVGPHTAGVLIEQLPGEGG